MQQDVIECYVTLLDTPVVQAETMVGLIVDWPASVQGSTVYFASTERDVKIGFSINPAERIQALGLRPLLFVAGAGRPHETALHRLFAAERTRRSEYFRADGAVAELIALGTSSSDRRFRDEPASRRLRQRVATLRGETVRDRTTARLIKKARLERGLSQRRLASLAGLSNAYICQLENEGPGTAKIGQPGLAAIRRLATALHLAPELILERAS